MMIEEVIKCIEANVGCLELDKSNGRVLYGSEEKFIEAGHYAIESMKELLEYKKLDTLEEVEDAMEKQTAEKPMKVLGINGNVEYECGYCGESEAINEMFSYCPWCGQKIDWRTVKYFSVPERENAQSAVEKSTGKTHRNIKEG